MSADYANYAVTQQQPLLVPFRAPGWGAPNPVSKLIYTVQQVYATGGESTLSATQFSGPLLSIRALHQHQACVPAVKIGPVGGMPPSAAQWAGLAGFKRGCADKRHTVVLHFARRPAALPPRFALSRRAARGAA